MTIAFQSSRPAVCDCHKMSFNKRTFQENYSFLIKKPVDPPPSQWNPQQHHGNTVGSAAADRPGLTPSASTTQFANTSVSGFGGFGAKLEQQPTGNGFSFEAPAASGQSVFRSHFEQQPTGNSLSFGGSAASSQSGSMFGATPNINPDDTKSGFGGSVKPVNNQGGNDQMPNKQPPPPNTTSKTGFEDAIFFYFEEDDYGKEINDLNKDDNEHKEQKDIGHKRKGDSTGIGSSAKKSKLVQGLPDFGEKGFFQHVYRFLKDSTGNTGVKKTSEEANEIWKCSKPRQTYFDKLAKAFKQYSLEKGVTRNDWDKKRDALAKRLSEIANMCTASENDWKEPTDSHESLFKPLFK